MIKKTLFCFLFFFSLNILFRDVLRPDIEIAQSQMQSNHVKAQKYLYSKTAIANSIIVGSSLSCRLEMDKLPDFCNLAFGGENSYIGLELILQKKTYPKYVFIETNLLFRLNDTEFNQILYNPILSTLRREIPSLRDGKQPLPYIETFIEDKILPLIIPYRFKSDANMEEQNKGADKEIQTREIKLQENSYNSRVSNAEKNEARIKLKDYIDTLESHGVSVVLFEMPINKILCESPRQVDLRNMLRVNFPQSKYIYLRSTICGEYETTDGIHLGKEEAARYTHFFKMQVDSIIHARK